MGVLGLIRRGKIPKSKILGTEKVHSRRSSSLNEAEVHTLAHQLARMLVVRPNKVLVFPSIVLFTFCIEYNLHSVLFGLSASLHTMHCVIKCCLFQKRGYTHSV
ncbi:hypothetical protein TESG_07078 [Trichophyton tonsurans CBS 112818]|uniref:Uncharacterized protein n=2 Tax=Trichophyton TaxID=5550 RepID=F2Q5E7_TRIEC|nr:hypothetical protein TESG_07078 [Trichophyton tonsurans CBS 112818]EGE09365.1 hypothetical protein TEQG_08341 [Trichophyton equinum CBS 127.97]